MMVRNSVLVLTVASTPTSPATLDIWKIPAVHRHNTKHQTGILLQGKLIVGICTLQTIVIFKVSA